MRQDYIWGSPVSMDYMYFTKHWLKFGFTNQKSLKINDQLQNIHSKQTGDVRPTKNKCLQQIFSIKTISMNYNSTVHMSWEGEPSLTTQRV